jgi:predicted PurR-regulated permease PerM
MLIDGPGDETTGGEGADPLSIPSPPPSTWDVPPWLDQVAGWIWRLALVVLAAWVFLRLFGMFRLVTVPILFALIEEASRSGLASFGASRARSITEVVGSVILTGVLVFFFVKDRPVLWTYAVERVRPDRRRVVSAAGDAAFQALSGYARGVALTGIVDAVPVILTVLAAGGAVAGVVGALVAVPLTAMAVAAVRAFRAARARTSLLSSTSATPPVG